MGGELNLLRREGKRRKSWRRFFGWGLVLTVAVYAVSNLVLAGLVEKKLQERTPLRWSVGRASWSPWSGLQMSGIRAEVEVQGGVEVAPVLEVGRVQIDPYWSSLFQKRPRFREVLVEEPKGNVPVQLLSLLVAAGGGAEVPQVAGSGIAADPDPALPKKKKPSPSGKSSKKKTGEKPVKKSGKEKPVDEKKEDPPGLPCRVRVQGGELRVYSLGSPDRAVRVTGITLNLPIAGPEAEGSVQIAGMSVGKFSRVGPLDMAVHWKQPFLVLPREEVVWEGLKMHFAGRVQTMGRPRFSVAMQVMPGGVEAFDLPEWTGLRLGVENVKVGFLRCEGDLRRPRTWQADLVADVRGIEFAQKTWEVGHRFDVGQVVAVFRQGVLNVADARLRSEELSFMGNGVVTANGRVWSVLRLVAAPDYAYVINRAAVGSNISQGWVRSWLKPMGTRDRLYRDIKMEGTVTNMMADVGRKREELEIRRVLEMVQRFLRGETREEEPVAPASGEEAASS